MKTAHWFWLRNFFFVMSVYVAIASVCLQIGSVFSCRPWEIVHDLRHMSMLAVQLFGFLTCLFFSFGLGVMCVLFDCAIW
jgi:hypothetical protein